MTSAHKLAAGIVIWVAVAARARGGNSGQVQP